jgi:hypothetical protein
LSAIAGDMVAGLNRRTPTNTIKRSEVDHMLRDACHDRYALALSRIKSAIVLAISGILERQELRRRPVSHLQHV